jgi:hypothetical protein
MENNLLDTGDQEDRMEMVLSIKTDKYIEGVFGIWER